MEEVKTSLMDSMQESQKFYETWVKEFGERYQVQGRTINEWRQYFYIKIPPDIDVSVCKDIDVKLTALFQDIAYMKGKAEASLHMQKTRYNQQFRAKYSSLVRRYEQSGRKLPAKDTLMTLTEDELTTEKDAIAWGEMEVAFWKEMQNNLNTVRKIIENATLNISVEAKAMSYQNMLEHAERKHGRSNEEGRTSKDQ